jgi:RHS repeat-associated protein
LPAAPTLGVDWDGDGRTDLLADVGGYWTVYKSEANTYTTISTNIGTGTGTWITTDMNGDGLDDLVFANHAAGGALYYGLHNGAGVHPDLATKFTDGYGNAFSPSYVSIAESDYTNATDATAGYENYIGPLYVVSQATYSDPTNMPNGTYNQSFLYWGLWKNLQGRGMQAFKEIRVQDSRRNLYDFYYYDRSFPTTGLLNQHNHLQSDGVTPITLTTNATASETLDGTADNQRYFPYIGTSTTNTYEVSSSQSENGQPVTQSVTQYGSPDAYGNFSSVKTTVTDEDSGSPNYGGTWVTTTDTTLSPDTSTWCLDLPTQVSVTKSNSTSDGAAITRTIQYNNPDYTNCRETEEVVAPGTSYQVTIAYAYDSFGNLKTQTVTGASMAPRITSFYWGTTGQFLTTVTNPLSQITTFTHDPNTGMLTSVQDPNGITTSWQYDDFARRNKETRPDGTSTTWSYNDCTTSGCVNSNNKMTVTQTVQNVGGTTQSIQNTYFDAFDRPLVVSKTMLNGAYDRREVQYDDMGNVRLQGEPCTFISCTANWTTNTYDVDNRLIESQRPISATNPSLQATTYQYSGRTTTITDPLGHTTMRMTLVTGNLARVQGANGYYENLYYDAFGSLIRITDSASPANTLYSAQYAYGIGAFRTSSSDMDLGSRTYTVDALGEVTQVTDAKSQNIVMQYDALSRPYIRTEPADTSGTETTTWTWGTSATAHNIGQLQSISEVESEGTYTAAYTYDADGRPSTETLSLPLQGSFTYTRTYDSTTGLLATLQYPVSTSGYQLKLQYGYANGILQSVSDYNAPSTVFWTANAQDPRGQVTQETLGNGVVANHTYDAVTGWIDSIQAGVGGGSALQNNAYLFDEDGNVTQQQDNNLGLTENFYYDNMNRLSHSTLNGTTNLSITYDTTGMGNIASRSDVAGGAAWTYDPVHKHQVIQAGSSAYQYAYDANGNVTSRDGSSITWSSYNYPIGIDGSGESLLFAYGPFRQRWMMQYSGPSGTETTYNTGRRFEEVVSGGVTDYRHYIFAGNELVAVYNRSSTGTNTLTYVLSDHQASFAHLITSTGTNDVTESFTAYGNRRSGTAWSGPPSSGDQTAIDAVSRRGYTGQTMLGVSMGLVDLNGRVLDADIGRFLSADPYVQDPGNTQDFNRYGYVYNNPLTLDDPSGFTSHKCQDGGCDTDNGNPPPNPQEWGCPNGTCPTQFGYGSRIPSGITPPAGGVDFGGWPGAGGRPSGGGWGGGSGAKSQQSNPTQCHHGTSLGNSLIQYGRDTATFGGATAAVGGGIIAVGAVGTATVAFAPEGVAAMGTGAMVAGAGGTITYIGLGMQAVGGVLNAARGNYGSLVSAGVQTAAAGIDALVGHFFPNLPDVLGPYNPVDVAAESAGDRLGGGGTCP